jgi:hypothetical protein
MPGSAIDEQVLILHQVDQTLADSDRQDHEKAPSQAPGHKI